MGENYSVGPLGAVRPLQLVAEWWLRDKVHVGSHSPVAQQQTSGFHGLMDMTHFSSGEKSVGF